ncbi:hypothetical protein DFP72DRAFT_1125391 [Ephemerocybe angulata]|uniref:Chromo domain-containing protein n=1 Tax=Ephemerocybe angulata TaxID=980116 RepID=A0A8H6LU45_9AGAR|nr:hypothetical protein DFP72DRAFT_1125391 [Tulosesus angulatus]
MAYNSAYKRPPLAYCPPDTPRLPPEIDAQGNARWYINNIVNARLEGNQVKYCVRWLTYPEEDETWEDEANLIGTAALRKWQYYQQIPVHLPVDDIVSARPYADIQVAHDHPTAAPSVLAYPSVSLGARVSSGSDAATPGADAQSMYPGSDATMSGVDAPNYHPLPSGSDAGRLGSDHTSSHALNCTSSAPIPATQHHFPLDDTASTSNTDTSPSTPASGSYQCARLLRSQRSHGVFASPFSNEVSVLRSLLDLHGLIHTGLPSSCATLAVDFSSNLDMAITLFHTLAVSRALDIGDDRLTSIALCLNFNPPPRCGRYRRRLQNLFTREEVRLNATRRNDSCTIPSLLASCYEDIDIGSLHNIAVDHGVQFFPATTSRAVLQNSLIAHFAESVCLRSTEDSPTPGCRHFASVVSTSSQTANLAGVDVNNPDASSDYTDTVHLVRVLTAMRLSFPLPALPVLCSDFPPESCNIRPASEINFDCFRRPDRRRDIYLFFGNLFCGSNSLFVATISFVGTKWCLYGPFQSAYDEVSSRPTEQHGFRGNIVVYLQDPSAISATLPPSLEELANPIAVVFVGSHAPTQEWLKRKQNRYAFALTVFEWLSSGSKPTTLFIMT